MKTTRQLNVFYGGQESRNTGSAPESFCGFLQMSASAQAGAFVMFGTGNLVLRRNNSLYTDAEGKR